MCYTPIGIALAVILCIWLFYYCLRDQNRDKFTISTTPFREENALLRHNPFDDVDYITPTFSSEMRLR